VFERVRADYVEKPDGSKLIESAINGAWDAHHYRCGAFPDNNKSRDQGHNLIIVGLPLADHRGQIMKLLSSAQLFAAPARAAKTHGRLGRAKSVIVAARERAAETARQCAGQPSTMRPPTVLQRRRLVGKFSGKC